MTDVIKEGFIMNFMDVGFTLVMSLGVISFVIMIALMVYIFCDNSYSKDKI